MRLSESDRRSLSEIARAIEIEDPEFAGLLGGKEHSRLIRIVRRGGRAALTGDWRMLTVGVMVLIVPAAIAVLTVGLLLSSAAVATLGGTLLLVDALVAGTWWLFRQRAAGADAAVPGRPDGGIP